MTPIGTRSRNDTGRRKSPDFRDDFRAEIAVCWQGLAMIRRAGAEDAETLAQLNAHVQGWHAAQYPETFFALPDPEGLVAYYKGRLAEPGCTAFLAGDPAQGYALCSLQAREASVFSPAIRRVLVEQIAVASDARRKGLGRALMQAARDLARELQVDEMVLDTWEANHAAQGFFRAEGYSPIRMLFRRKP